MRDVGRTAFVRWLGIAVTTGLVVAVWAQDPDPIVVDPAGSGILDATGLVPSRSVATVVSLPEPAEILRAVDLMVQEGPSALDATPFFSTVISFDALDTQPCGVVAPLVMRAAAHHADPEGTLGLLEAVDRRLAEPPAGRRGPSVIDVLGEDWSVQVPELEIEGDDPVGIETPPDIIGRIDAGRRLAATASGIDDTGIRLAALPSTRGAVGPLGSAVVAQTDQEPMVGQPPIRLFRQIRNNAPTLFDGIPQVYAAQGPRGGFDRMCTKGLPEAGIDPGTEFVYRVKNNVYIYYHLCGPRAITAQKVLRDAAGDVIAQENGSFPYKYPDGSVALIRRCRTYTKDCAPTHVQMIAADLTYAREAFKAHGFDVPGGGMTSAAPEIPVHITQSGERSTAHLGRIWLHEPLDGGGRKMRWLAFHEYFHLVQFTHRADLAFVQGIHNWSAKPRDTVPWTAPPDNLTYTTFFWGNLESMASFAADVLLEDYPSYALSGNSWNDGRGYPFFSSYADLVYGYLAERFGGPDRFSSLTEMAGFVKDYLTPISSVTPYDGYKWAQVKYLELYLQAEGLTLAEFVEQYHQDLVYTLFADPPEGGRTFRWSYLGRPGRGAWSWPPKLGTLPIPTGPGGIGTCTNGQAMRKANAKPVSSDPDAALAVRYTCRFRMAPAGALHLRLPLSTTDRPSLISVRAGSFSSATPNEPSPAAPQLILIPAAEGPKAATEVGDLVAVGRPVYSSDQVLGSRTALASYGPTPSALAEGFNSVFVIVRYPDFWNRLKMTAEDHPDISVGGQRPYVVDPIRMEVEVKGVW